MENYNDNGFLEELLALSSDSWDNTTTIPMELTDFYNNIYNYDTFIETPVDNFPLPCTTNSTTTTTSTTSSVEDLSNFPFHQALNCSFYCQFGGELSPPEVTDSSNNRLGTPPFPSQEDLSSILEYGVGNCSFQNLEMGNNVACKLEEIQVSEEEAAASAPGINIGLCPEIKMKSKKVNGQPAKNLMAERRRRKRLNDRLSMLRSIVPKISKMDRTSILGDTIDYMKELLDRINNLQEEMELGTNQLSLMSIFKDVKPNEMLVRNSPKFDVERRNADTKVEICCSGKRGLLLSTVTTLEALGLEIEQCVISCFNDFAMQTSCSEEMEQKGVVSSEDIKQALLRNAGYGGTRL